MKATLHEAHAIAVRISEDLAHDRSWFSGAPCVVAEECDCECHHEGSFTEPMPGQQCGNCFTRSIDEADDSGACFDGFRFEKHDSREM